MTEERTTPLRERMIEDMRIHGMGDKAQKAHIRAVRDFAAFLERTPGTATPDDLRAYHMPMTDTGVTPTTYNARIMALRILFVKTCGREDMKRYMQFRTQPQKLSTVLSVEDVSELLAAAPGPGLKYRAALRISYDGGGCASGHSTNAQSPSPVTADSGQQRTSAARAANWGIADKPSGIRTRNPQRLWFTTVDLIVMRETSAPGLQKLWIGVTSHRNQGGCTMIVHLRRAIEWLLPSLPLTSVDMSLPRLPISQKLSLETAQKGGLTPM